MERRLEKPRLAGPDAAAVQALLDWYGRERRNLPWRDTKDPYRIWISEIMLQQTRVEAALPYYRRFLERFPDVGSLAAASEPEVLERWAGLGYYRRARQLHQAARRIAEDCAGVFPADYEAIKTLPGVGEYTAAAVGSIAFGLPYAAADGNVLRVMARLLADDRDIAQGAVRKALAGEAWRMLAAAGSPGDFNQAMMELGATVCRPRKPRCAACPLRQACRAAKQGVQESLPVKSRRVRVERREIVVALVERGRSLLMRRRPADDAVMPGFWELPQAEGVRLAEDCLEPEGIRFAGLLGEFRHAITFRSYSGRVYAAELTGARPRGHRWVSHALRRSLPVATIARKALHAASFPV